jgi:hypothetical protein
MEPRSVGFVMPDDPQAVSLRLVAQVSAATAMMTARPPGRRRDRDVTGPFDRLAQEGDEDRDDDDLGQVVLEVVE